MLDKNVHLPGVQFDASDAYNAEQAEKFGCVISSWRHARS